MKYILASTVILSFLVTLLIIPPTIRYLKKLGLVVKDMNKETMPLIPLSGGFAVFVGIFMGIMASVFVQSFYYKTETYVVGLLAAIITIFALTLVGFIDDLLIKTGNEASYGLRQWQKPLLSVFAAVPLMVVNAGISNVWVPFIGRVELGLLYPLVVIPVIVIGAGNMVNLIGGLNGIEAGMGLVYTGMLGLYAYANGRDVAALIAFLCFAALIAFLLFNWYPAKIFPGNSLTYLLGGLLAAIAILGNMEKAALIASIPFFAEFFLKIRTRFRAQCYGKYENGKVKSIYGNRIYSLVHLFTRRGLYSEKQVACFLILIELAFCSLIWVV
ncbi:hypothetical protein HZB88_03345 [archaeon]|nr:hypothetical protein [archaeon]